MESSSNKYLFTSSRLGFRTWIDSDVENMSVLNSDPTVMEFFPSLPSKKETAAFIYRMQQQFLKYGFCYFPVDHLETNEFIGFIGLSTQNFESDFTPCVDIGWRIHKNFWGKGLATEGAKVCLTYSQQNLKLKQVYSMASNTNMRSIKVMKKIGMSYFKEFNHPKLSQYPLLKKCVLYSIDL